MPSFGVYDSTLGTTTDRTLLRWGNCPTGEETLQGYNTNEVAVALATAVNCTMDEEAHYNGTTGVITISAMTKASDILNQEQLVTRNSLLTYWDWFMTADVSTRLANKKNKEIKKYRQALRDVPNQGGFPGSIIWPTVPVTPTPVPYKDPISLMDAFGVLSSLFTFTRASTGLMRGKRGWYFLASSNTPRVEFDPATGDLIGLLMEPARTNLLLRSYTFDTAPWTATRASVTSPALLAPDATLACYRIIEDTTATSTHQIQQDITTAATSTYYRTVVLKAGTRTKAVLIITSPGMTTITLVVDLSAGTISSGTGFIKALNAGWYQISFAFTTVTGGTTTVYTRLHDGTTANYTGDGVSYISVWADQTELGNFPTSLIFTTTATVTRAADAASLTLTDFFNPDGSTIFVEANYNYGSGLHDQNRTVLSFDDGSANNQVMVYNRTGYMGLLINSGAVAQTTINGGTNDDQYHQVACGWALNNVGFSNDGVTLTTDTVVALPVAMNTLRIGCRVAADKELGGYIRDLKYWDAKLPNDQILALTT